MNTKNCYYCGIGQFHTRCKPSVELTYAPHISKSTISIALCVRLNRPMQSTQDCLSLRAK